MQKIAKATSYSHILDRQLFQDIRHFIHSYKSEAEKWQERMAEMKRVAEGEVDSTSSDFKMFPVRSETNEPLDTPLSRIYSASAESQGWRDSMEDAIISGLDVGSRSENGVSGTLFAVFDGHGGPMISAFSKFVFPRIFNQKLQKIEGGSENTKQIIKALKESLAETDRMLLSEQGQLILTFIKIELGWLTNEDDSGHQSVV